MPFPFAALAGLIPVITQAMPILRMLLGTPAEGNLLVKAADIAERVFGTKDPGQIQLQIEQDKNKLERFRLELENETKMELAWLQDTQSARDMQKVAMSAGSNVQWVPVIMTLAIFLMFVIAFYLSVSENIRVSNVAAQQMVGAIIAAFATAYSYWLGSSRGSSQKEGIIATIAATTAQTAMNEATKTSNGSSTPQKMFR